MRTNIDLDEVTLQQVLLLGDFSTKKAAIQAALNEYLNVLKRQKLLALRGKVAWRRPFSLPGFFFRVTWNPIG